MHSLVGGLADWSIRVRVCGSAAHAERERHVLHVFSCPVSFAFPECFGCVGGGTRELIVLLPSGVCYLYCLLYMYVCREYTRRLPRGSSYRLSLSLSLS